jgi:uncharacterized protein
MTHMQDRLLNQSISSSTSHILLLGPRQVGKSTLVRALAPDLYLTLADEGEFLRYSKNPVALLQEVRALRQRSVIVIDEIQRVPALLNSCQVLMDDNPLTHRFILTGSSARKLKHGQANLLSGRVVVDQMSPLLLRETKFDLDRTLAVGALPGIYLNIDSGAELLQSYANTYLREEIQAEGLVQNIGSFSRLLDVVALSSGQWLNYSKLSSDSEIPKETVRRYITLLEDTLVLFRLPPYRPRNARTRRVTQHEKIFLFDVGVRNALLGQHAAQLSADQRGPAFEHWITQQIFGFNQTVKKGWTLSSFRTSEGHEVDLVVETNSEIIGLEIKSGRTLHERTYRGLNALAQQAGSGKPFKKWVIFQGERELLLEDQTRVMPYLSALEELATHY